MDTRDNKSDDEYSIIGDKGDIGFIDFDQCQSVCSYNPSGESDVVHISVPFPLIDGKPQSGAVGKTMYDMLIIKNISNEPLDLWSVSIYDSKPENSFTISLREPPNSNSDLQYIQDFMETFCLEDRVLRPNRSLTIWLSCKPKEIGVHSAAVHFTVGNETIERLVFVLAEDEISKSLCSKKPYQRSRRKKQEWLNVHAPDAAYFVGRRPSKASIRVTRYHLPIYPIPECIRTMVNNEQIPDAVNEGLTPPNYASFFKALLAMEEIKLEKDMHAYDMESVTLKCRKSQFLSLEVLGLAEKRPSLVIGDYIFAKSASKDETANSVYQGYIHRVEAEEIYLKFDVKFHTQHMERNLYNVQFSYNRIGMRKLYQALEAARGLGQKFLFPSVPHGMMPHRPSKLVPLSCTLNNEQVTAVKMILACKGGFPYVIHGPPGTGKSMTLVEAIIQVYVMNRKSAILVCAPSNSAADHLLERITGETSVEIKRNEIFRLNAYSRPLEDINPKHMDLCYVEDEFFKCPERWVLEKYRIIVSTYTSTSHLYAEELRRGHFSHIFLDEAGQASEPETMVPLSRLCTNRTVVVLAGDPMQLGPVVFCKDAESSGLGTSYLQRLLNVRPYNDGDKSFMTKLVRNYRSHEAILRLPSEMFYDGALIPCKGGESFSTTSWEDILPNKKFPVLFIGIQGIDEREGSNPSWFNRVEASKVVDMIRVLIEEKELKQEDIGVITPYRQQVCKIRCTLENLGMPEVKVGSVEQFQGQEKEVIIISTVRSTIKHNEFDRAHYLGFLNNSKRFNVLVTRAKSLLVVIGNPHILCKDPNWNRLLWYCVDNNSYKGCFLPEREAFSGIATDFYSGYEAQNNSGNWDNGGSDWNASGNWNNDGGDWNASGNWDNVCADGNASEGQWGGAPEQSHQTPYDDSWGIESNNPPSVDDSLGMESDQRPVDDSWGSGLNDQPQHVDSWGDTGPNDPPQHSDSDSWSAEKQSDSCWGRVEGSAQQSDVPWE